MDNNNRKSTFLSLVFHLLILIAALSFKTTSVLVPSRSNGMEVGIVSQADLNPVRTTPIIPQAVKQQAVKIENVNNAEVQMKQPDSTPVPPKPITKPRSTKKPATKSVKQINDLINGIAPTQQTASNKGTATGGSNLGSSDTNSLIPNYADAVINRVRPFVIIPDNTNPEAKTVIEVTLLPNMNVYKAILIKSSGNDEYDNNVLQAINRVNVFPPLPEGASFSDFRKLRLTFRPQ
ncbi:MAG: colicin import rane protein [Pseudomonadota bacterium]|nr:colicin import rane protein [Pseudomonadota bacterium]